MAGDIEDSLRLALGEPTAAFSIDDNHVELDGDIVRRLLDFSSTGSLRRLGRAYNQANEALRSDLPVGYRT